MITQRRNIFLPQPLLKNGVEGRSPSNIAPAWMQGVYATRLCRTQSPQSVLKGIENLFCSLKNRLFPQAEIRCFNQNSGFNIFLLFTSERQHRILFSRIVRRNKTCYQCQHHADDYQYDRTLPRQYAHTRNACEIVNDSISGNKQ